MNFEGDAVLFEPWALGDAVIAAAAYRFRPQGKAIVCHSRWIEMLQEAFPKDVPSYFQPIDLPYTTRLNAGKFDFGNQSSEAKHLRVTQVFSIRGDMRDWIAAKKHFPGVKVNMTGWIPFFSRRFRVLDLPYQSQLFPVRNRYEAWSRLLGFSFEDFSSDYLNRRMLALKKVQNIVFHVGAQWKSKQYPDILELMYLFRKQGFENLQLIAGPGDSLPKGIGESEVQRLLGKDLVHCFQQAEVVIANDSGPMHLAAFLGCKTVSVGLTSNLKEWLPPGALGVFSDRMPLGYRALKVYSADLVLDGWPSAEQVFSQCLPFILDRA